MIIEESNAMLPFCEGVTKIQCTRNNVGESQNVSHPEAVSVSVYTSHALSSESSGTVREKWTRNIEFLLSCVALSVGFGNVWRFPYTALNNGGGAFVVPYLVVLLVVGRPLYYLEMIVGQFSSRGCVKVFDMCPLMRGVGVGQTITMFTIIGYYAALLSLAIRYFVDSFQYTLPWSVCQSDWDCVDSSKASIHISNSSTTKPSAEFYFTRVVTNHSPDLNNGIGIPNYQLVLCLLVSWILITVLVIKGIKSSGKASYFLAIFPYVILFGLLIRSVTLDGAFDGIKYFITPQWGMLLDTKVWYEAISQCFFSLTVGLGAVIVYSSFNNFSNNIYRDAMIISWLDTFTSMLSGVIVFGVVGNVAYITKKNVTDVMKGGPELTFVVYPDALAKMPTWPNFISMMFFLMFILLGLGSNMGIVTTILTSIKDRYPRVTIWKVVVAISVAGFSCGLVYISPGGFHVLDIVDYYGVTFPTLILVVLEAFTFCWLYGVDRICIDIKFMLDIKTGVFWRVCWGFLTLLILLIITCMQIFRYEAKKVPVGYNVFGWSLFGVTVLQVVGWAIYTTAKQPKSCSIYDNMRGALQPTADWGPESEKMKRDYDTLIANYKIDRNRVETLRARLFNKIFK
ncbi:sodium-dependent nutrient amino acid transporter 1-like isoform X2 [Armigeres subalbatus]|uniref:sodium-dependent nutrient amino acid transporter 1-like isoform X2 n=1 Tax=Armigeres subalbatus TaxID=124917 RepID=UPI002ECFCD6E